MADTRIDRLNRSCQAGTAVGHYQPQFFAFQPSLKWFTGWIRSR